MPIKVFFKMYDEAIRMEAAQFRENLDIAMVPTMKFKYYTFMRERYNSIIFKNKRKLPPKPPDMHIDAGSQDAQNVMRGVFGSLKRGMGYG